MQYIDKDLLAIQEARVLLAKTCDAHKMASDFSQKALDKICAAMFQTMKSQADQLIQQEIAETGIGNVQDESELFKNFVVAFEHYLDSQTVVGPLKKDDARRMVEVGRPLGRIGALLPATNVVLNTFYTVITALKSGNALIVIPNAVGLATTSAVMELLIHCANDNGLPKGNLVYMENISPDGVAAIVNGVELMIIADNQYDLQTRDFHNFGKPTIFGGAGSTPVFIEHSADIKAAVQKIIASRAYANGTLPGAEQYVIAESCVSTKVKQEMQAQGAYFMTSSEESKLISYIKEDNGKFRLNCTGKSVNWLAQRAGITVPSGTKLLVSEQAYISTNNPFAAEITCPIVTFYLEPDWLHACEKCIALLKNRNGGHTMAIHSNNQQVIDEFIMKKPVGRVIVNDAATFASIGLTEGLVPSMVLGCLSAGKGVVAANVLPADLTYTRTVSYGCTSNKRAEKETTHHEEELIQLLKQLVKQDN
jgi:acyl-CoA reductase-like NAD-dependent aldehyde dehydrogenase